MKRSRLDPFTKEKKQVLQLIDTLVEKEKLQAKT